MDNNNNEAPQYYEQPAPSWNNDAPANEPGKGLAIASLVTGILSVVCCGALFIWLAAIICAVIAKSKGNKSAMATVGLILGIVGACLCLIGVIYNLTHPDQLQEIYNMLGM